MTHKMEAQLLFYLKNCFDLVCSVVKCVFFAACAMHVIYSIFHRLHARSLAPSLASFHQSMGLDDIFLETFRNTVWNAGNQLTSIVYSKRMLLLLLIELITNMLRDRSMLNSSKPKTIQYKLIVYILTLHETRCDTDNSRSVVKRSLFFFLHWFQNQRRILNTIDLFFILSIK